MNELFMHAWWHSLQRLRYAPLVWLTTCRDPATFF
jgi:hypothetical protein